MPSGIGSWRRPENSGKFVGRLVESQLYDVRPTDPVTMLAATLVLCSTALGAALIPARRASAVNPTEAIRFE
jgi:ABC-type lipoprotein release transport system permease subunit